jgi:hypothetical protein
LEKEAIVDIIHSYNKGMSTLVGTVNVNANLNNVNIKDYEQRKHERATRAVETNLRRTSTSQIKIPVTRREDFFMVNLSSEVIGKDFNNLVNRLDEECSSVIGQSNNTINLSDSIVNHKLDDEHILHNCSVNNNRHLSGQLSSNSLRVFHQNIQGLKYKTDELLNALYLEFPHILCITEHHMNSLDMNIITIDYYDLGAVYCRNSVSVHNSLSYSKISLGKFCIDQIIEICAVKLLSVRQNICIIAVYRASYGNFVQFLNILDRVLNTIYCPSVDFIICGDINIDYLKDSSRKKQLNTLLLCFNPFSMVDFPTRSQNKSASLIDNIFIDCTQSGKYLV